MPGGFLGLLFLTGCFVSVINSSRILLVAPERLMGQHFFVWFVLPVPVDGHPVLLQMSARASLLLVMCTLSQAGGAARCELCGKEIKMSCLTFHSI